MATISGNTEKQNQGRFQILRLVNAKIVVLRWSKSVTFVTMPGTRISKQKYCKMNEKGK